MRIFVKCLVALALATTTVVPAPAQLDPCEPDCPQTPFGALQNDTILLPGNCEIEVTYATRLACGTWQDLYIEYVKTVPTPPSPACQIYWEMSAKDLLWVVTQEMAETNPMGFTKPAPGCATDWRVVKGPCWFHGFDPSAGRYRASYCEATVCCLEPYEVCFDDCGDVTCFEPHSPYSPGDFLCDICHQTGDGCESCEAACGDPSWSEGGSCP